MDKAVHEGEIPGISPPRTHHATKMPDFFAMQCHDVSYAVEEGTPQVAQTILAWR